MESNKEPVSTPPVRSTIELVLNQGLQLCLQLRPASPREPAREISIMDSKKGPGFDLISPRLLKELPRKYSFSHNAYQCHRVPSHHSNTMSENKGIFFLTFSRLFIGSGTRDSCTKLKKTTPTLILSSDGFSPQR